MLGRLPLMGLHVHPLPQSSLSIPVFRTRGIPGGHLAQSLWKTQGPLAPLSCAWGPLGRRKQCIVVLASRISCSSPGPDGSLWKPSPESPMLPGQGQAQEVAGGGFAQSQGDLEERGLGGSGCCLLLGRRTSSLQALGVGHLPASFAVGAVGSDPVAGHRLLIPAGCCLLCTSHPAEMTSGTSGTLGRVPLLIRALLTSAPCPPRTGWGNNPLHRECATLVTPGLQPVLAAGRNTRWPKRN